MYVYIYIDSLIVHKNIFIFLKSDSFHNHWILTYNQKTLFVE